MITTPVAFIIFNRPDLTERVFEAIKKAKPTTLYIIADGPRFDEEALLTRQARSVTEHVDWPCEVTRLYSEINLGCKQRVISGLNAVFEAEDQAIILEDDCLPHPDFFEYCEILLTFYKDDPRIGTINGTCLPGLPLPGSSPGSCYFSRFSIVWGWATTKRFWQKVESEIPAWETLKNTNWLEDIFAAQKHIVYGVSSMFDQTRSGYDAWSYVLLFALLRNNALNVYPSQNLVSNIGFDARASHTRHQKSYSNLPLSESGWSHHHPASISHYMETDISIFETLYYWHLKRKSGFEKIKRKFWIQLFTLKQKLLPGISLTKKLFGR